MNKSIQANRKQLEPIDGKFVHDGSARERWCRENGHPLTFLNLSLSAKCGKEILRCLCGERETPTDNPITERKKGKGKRALAGKEPNV